MNGDARLRPWEIRRLTLPEIALLLDEHGDKPTPPANARPVTDHAEHVRRLERLRRMTPMERLKEEQDASRREPF